MMDSDPAKDDFQCVRNTIDDMIKIICDQNDSMEEKMQEKEENDKSEINLLPKRFSQTDQDEQVDQVSQEKISNSKFNDVKNSLFEISPTADQDIRSTVEGLKTSGKRLVDVDYIPLSCPVIVNGEEFLSESEKSFLKFLDDMQSLTTKEKRQAKMEQRPIFHVDCRKQFLTGVTDTLPATAQMPPSNMLTVNEILNSQESEHWNHLDSYDCGKEDQFFPPADNPRRSSERTRQIHSPAINMRPDHGTPYNEIYSQDHSADVMALGDVEVPDQNLESLLNFSSDSNFMDILPVYTQDTFNEIDIFQPQHHPLCDIDQFVNRQLQNAYDATDWNATDGDIVAQHALSDSSMAMTVPTISLSFCSSSSSPVCSAQNLISDSDKNSLPSCDQTDSKSASKIESNTGFPKLPTKSTNLVGQYSAELVSEDSECNRFSSTVHSMSENNISQVKPAPLSQCEEIVDKGELSGPGDATEVDPGSTEQVLISKHCCSIDITKLEHTLWNPQNTNVKEIQEEGVNSTFKEKNDILYADVDSCMVSDQPGFKSPEQQNASQPAILQFQPEYKSTSPKDQIPIVQIPSNQAKDETSMTGKMKDETEKESCSSKRDSGWNDQAGDAKCSLQQSAKEAVLRDVTQSKDHKNLRSNLSAYEDTLIAQNQNDAVLQQPILQVPEVAATTVGDDTAKDGNSSGLPSCAHVAVVLHEQAPDQEIESNLSDRSSFSQDKATRGVSVQLLPEESHLVPDLSNALQEKDYIVSEPEESLYEEGKLKDAKLPSPEFKWKYRPSCDGEDDLITPVEEDMEPMLGNIQPLMTGECSRSLRIGLSRKQKVKRLHKNIH